MEKYREGIGEKVPMLIYLVMSFVTAVIISFWYGWELTLVILSCAPVIIITTAVVAKVTTFIYILLFTNSIIKIEINSLLSAHKTVDTFNTYYKNQFLNVCLSTIFISL